MFTFLKYMEQLNIFWKPQRTLRGYQNGYKSKQWVLHFFTIKVFQLIVEEISKDKCDELSGTQTS